MTTNKETIKQELKKLGLKKGDLVFVHSALSALGKVEGGPDAVIEALTETVGPKGTVAMTRLGGALLAKIFAERQDTVEGIHPTHPVAAWGAKAKTLIRGHLEAETACGRETPFGRLIAWGGCILLLGVDQDRNTTLHTLEEYVDSPYLAEQTFTHHDETGRERTKLLKKFPGPHRNFIGLDRLFREAGVIKIGRVGNATARLMNARKMARVGLAALKADPAAVLCQNPNCADCVMQRGKIKERRLQAESFSLTAVNDEVSADPAETLTILRGQGIKQLELRTIKGRKPIDAVQTELREFRQALTEAGFKVSALNTGVNRLGLDGNLRKNREIFREYLDLAQFFRTGRLVISSFWKPEKGADRLREKAFRHLAEMAEMAGAKKITLLVENEPRTFAGSSGDCAAVFETVNSPYLRLAFNPANFAALGEHPFLGVPSRLRKFSGLLYVNDGLFSGTPQPPGGGNAEIKELISILRCRNFDGCLSLKPGLGGGKEKFNQAADAFWRLLNEM